MSYPKVSIVILNWNGVEDTIECLESLERITYPDYSVAVVDNASSGKDVDVLTETYGHYVHIIANDANYGFSEGNNVGIRYAMDRHSDYILLLNNDTVVDPEFLTELVEVAECSERVGICAGKVYYYDTPSKLQTVGGKVNWWLGTRRNFGGQEDVGQFDDMSERDFVYATAMLIKKDVVETIGLLDASFFFGIEEYDYCTRAIRAGFKVVYVPTSRVWHKAGASRRRLPDYPETQKRIERDTGVLLYKHFFKVFRKHSPAPLFPIAFLNNMARFGLLHLSIAVWGALQSCLRRTLVPTRTWLRVIFRRGAAGR